MSSTQAVTARLAIPRLSAWRCILPALLLAPGACTDRQSDDTVNVVFIGSAADLEDSGVRLSSPAQGIRAATAMGLVQFDVDGQIVPGLAESWIVTDDGSSYIFRLRKSTGDASALNDAAAVRRELEQLRGRLRKTSLGLDLALIRDIRALTGSVIEIRLRSPMPQMLQLLAQPELSLGTGNTAIGSMTQDMDEIGVELTPRSAEAAATRASLRTVRVGASSAAAAIEAFTQGTADVVLGGSLVDLPAVDTGPLARGTVRVESPIGLLGFDVTGATEFLADPQNREAVAMAIDRSELLTRFNLDGWAPGNRLVPADLPTFETAFAARWPEMDMAARRAEARRRVARYPGWKTDARSLRIALPPGPGADWLFEAMQDDLQQVGLTIERAQSDDRADLVLRDRVARYAHPLWFLNQMNCRVEPGLCSPEADRLLAEAARTADAEERRRLLMQAENTLTKLNRFIPLGAPIRWSLVRAGNTGFVENQLAVHPLFPLSRAPT